MATVQANAPIVCGLAEQPLGLVHAYDAVGINTAPGQMLTFLARIANRLPAGCVWLFPDAVVVEACHLLRLESLAVEAEIAALDAEIAANDGRIAELTSCLARFKAELG